MILQGVFFQLKKYKNHLNAINVFPIADGDTGANMYRTVEEVYKEVDAETDMHNFIDKLRRGSFMGATGNSGTILSQFFAGFCETAKKIKDIPDYRLLAECIERGTEKAYEAVQAPREGTILTVMRGVAKAATDYGTLEEKQFTGGVSEDLNKFSGYLGYLIDAGKETLKKTPLLLPCLEQAGVVDAGGQGFVYILEGAKRGVDEYLKIKGSG